MVNLRSVMCISCLILVTIFGGSIAVALPIGQAVEVTAEQLKDSQISDPCDPGAGSWPYEPDFTGSIVAGMVGAYESKCNPDYESSAILGGDYILYAAQGNYYGDEAFVLARLSQIAADPCDNDWRAAIDDFYYNVKVVSGTECYVSQFFATDSSTAAFYLAYHVVAAYYVDAEDKQIWRDALIDLLAQVSDANEFPVIGMGVATWALALTGPLDDTLVDRLGTGAPYWSGRTLADLPILLLSHQVPDGQTYAGSFYWRFDHASGRPLNVASGYTEDTIFATLGLIAASRADPDLPLDGPILAARQALLGGVPETGIVYEHLWLNGVTYFAYAGEMLQVLDELTIAGDLNLDDSVDYVDLGILVDSWLASGCTGSCWCGRADLDQSGEVNFADFALVAAHWLEDAIP